MILSGCGGGGGSTGPSINVTGTYRVNGASSVSGRFTATAVVQQNGSSVSGTYTNNTGGQFLIEGSVSGTHLSGRLVGLNNPSVCNAEADFFPDGQVGNGSYSCSAANQTDAGTFTTVRIG
jgi:hypothetical protein